MTLLGRIAGVGALASVIITTAVAPVLVPGVTPETISPTASVEFETEPRIASAEFETEPSIASGELAVGWHVADTASSVVTTGADGSLLPLVDVAVRLIDTATNNASSVEPQFFAPLACFPIEPCGSNPPPRSEQTHERLTGPLYVDTTSRAAYEARRLENEGRLSEAADIRVIAEQPQAVWINGNETGAALTATLSAHRARADAAGQRLVVVTYAIPFRDCGSYSAGGLTAEQYPGWNQTVADALRGSGAIVIVEPDGLTGVTQPACASVAQSRPAMIKNAVETLAAAGLHVYIDAGHSNWVGDAQIADLLTQAGVASARGFATNVSNYRTTQSEIDWAQRVSNRLGGKRFVIDVSRNGNGPNTEWCNPLGRALGANPTLDVNNGALDGLLWVKRPGESDGTCNGGPTAGHWWEAYAIGLVRSR